MPKEDVPMRGHVKQQSTMLSLSSPGDMVPADHPLRRIKPLVDGALARMTDVFDDAYAEKGRASIPPERLLKSLVLIALHSVRSERQFCEQLGYNLLFRWFLDMGTIEKPFDHSTFSANRERLLKLNAAHIFFEEVFGQAKQMGLTSSEHFTVDGSLIDAWASLKSFKKKDDDNDDPPPSDPHNPDVNFRGEKRSNKTHESTTDPESKLARKGNGKEAKLSFLANVVMENRNGLIAEMNVTQATGTAECDAALDLLNELPGDRITAGGDKGYDRRSFVSGCRERRITPHVAQKKRYSAIDERTVRHPGWTVSQRVRKRVEEIFGWMKTIGGFRKTKYRGRERTEMAAMLIGAAYNLVRMANLAA
jgi:transposase